MLEIWELGGMRGHPPGGGRKRCSKEQAAREARGNLHAYDRKAGCQRTGEVSREPGTVLTPCSVSWFQVLSNLTHNLLRGVILS